MILAAPAAYHEKREGPLTKDVRKIMGLGDVNDLVLLTKSWKVYPYGPAELEGPPDSRFEGKVARVGDELFDYLKDRPMVVIIEVPSNSSVGKDRLVAALNAMGSGGWAQIEVTSVEEITLTAGELEQLQDKKISWSAERLERVGMLN